MAKAKRDRDRTVRESENSMPGPGEVSKVKELVGGKEDGVVNVTGMFCATLVAVERIGVRMDGLDGFTLNGQHEMTPSTRAKLRDVEVDLGKG